MLEIFSGTLLAYTNTGNIGKGVYMKKMMETVKAVIEEIRKDIGIYLTIQRYARLSRGAKEE